MPWAIAKVCERTKKPNQTQTTFAKVCDCNKNLKTKNTDNFPETHRQSGCRRREVGKRTIGQKKKTWTMAKVCDCTKKPKKSRLFSRNAPAVRVPTSRNAKTHHRSPQKRHGLLRKCVTVQKKPNQTQTGFAKVCDCTKKTKKQKIQNFPKRTGSPGADVENLENAP